MTEFETEFESGAVELTCLADQATQSVRAINHATIVGPALPRPVRV